MLKFKKLSKERQAKNYKMLQENEVQILEELSSEMPYNEVLASVIPMSYENPFEEHSSACELISANTKDGCRMGFYVPLSASFLMLQPNVEEKRIEMSVAFVDKEIGYSLNIDFATNLKGHLYHDAEECYKCFEENKETITNMLLLLAINEEDVIIQ